MRSSFLEVFGTFELLTEVVKFSGPNAMLQLRATCSSLLSAGSIIQKPLKMTKKATLAYINDPSFRELVHRKFSATPADLTGMFAPFVGSLKRETVSTLTSLGGLALVVDDAAFEHYGHDLLRFFPNITDLHFVDTQMAFHSEDEYTAASPLVALPALEKLSISGGDRHDFGWLNGHPKLRVLELDVTEETTLPENYAIISDVKNLESVTLRGSEHVGLFARMPSVKSLDISGRCISDLTEVVNIFPNLEILNISRTDVYNLGPLAQLRKLKQLNASRCKRLNTLVALEPLAETLVFLQVDSTVQVPAPLLKTSLNIHAWPHSDGQLYR